MIDFHTHVFPDAIAGKVLKSLSSVSGAMPHTNGTISGLVDSTKEAGIDISVLLPVVTNPSQFRSINEYSASMDYPNILAFGGIHPDSANYKEELRTIKSLGLKGIKLHPDYQKVQFNDIRYKRLVSYATELDLIVSVHAGVDIGLPNPVHCTPEMSLDLIRDVQPEKLVLAHMGGYDLWEQVEELLVGENVYLDTSNSIPVMSDEQFIRIVKNHGEDKILFATDSPWTGQKESISDLKKLPIPEHIKQKIFDENARKLLTLS